MTANLSRQAAKAVSNDRTRYYSLLDENQHFSAQFGVVVQDIAIGYSKLLMLMNPVKSAFSTLETVMERFLLDSLDPAIKLICGHKIRWSTDKEPR